MRTLVLLTLALVACGDNSDADPSVDASTVDAPLPLDAAVDAPAQTLVGTWDRQVFGSFDPTRVVAFADGGVLHWGEDVGTWSILANGQLRAAAPPNRPTGTAPFYLSPDGSTLMMEAMFPTTPTDGLLGTWEGEYRYADGTLMETTMEFRADQTLTWSDTMHGITRTDEGTWRFENGASVIIEARLDGTTPVTVGMRMLPDVVLGNELFYRAE